MNYKPIVEVITLCSIVMLSVCSLSVNAELNQSVYGYFNAIGIYARDPVSYTNYKRQYQLCANRVL